MLYSEIIAVSQIHTKHINTLCGQNVEFFNVKLCGTYSDQRDLKGKQNCVWIQDVDKIRQHHVNICFMWFSTTLHYGFL